MNPMISTKDPAAVAQEIQAAYLAICPRGDEQFVPRVFRWASDAFNGNYADYQAVDARNHDFEHTLQGALCMARILQGRHKTGINPELPQRMVELGLIAILLHDTGYLKKRGDNEGTGAKYTVTHVSRSCEFAAQLLEENGFAEKEIVAVQNMICSTGVDALLKVIPFQSGEEKITGLCLGAADLLGQMAADDYIEKLPVLYAEFAEAQHGSAPKSEFVNMFSSAKDLLKKTPGFWEKYVKQKLDRDLDDIHRFLNDPFPDGPNFYMDKIEANIERLRKVISSEADTTQFLKKYHAA